jgi:hypothetical protein
MEKHEMDETVSNLVTIIRREIQKQCYVDLDGPDSVFIYGWINLREIAARILEDLK